MINKIKTVKEICKDVVDGDFTVETNHDSTTVKFILSRPLGYDGIVKLRDIGLYRESLKEANGVEVVLDNVELDNFQKRNISVLMKAIERLRENTTKSTLDALWLIKYDLGKSATYCGVDGVIERLLFKHEAYDEQETIEKCVVFLQRLIDDIKKEN